MTQRNLAAKGAPTLPTTTWPDRAPGLVGCIGYVEPIGRSEPFCLFSVPSPPLLDRDNPSRASIIVSYDCSLPRHPFTESLLRLARAGVAGIMARNRYAENWLTRRDWSMCEIFNKYFDTLFWRDLWWPTSYVAHARVRCQSDETSRTLSKSAWDLFHTIHFSKHISCTCQLIDHKKICIICNIYWV